MRVFISWSGARSNAVATALLAWLPKWVPGLDLFHSQDIPKGSNWHSALVAALRDCQVGIFCATPESLRSPWLLFEAGAMAQHGERPTLLTYVYGVQQIVGPLGAFQVTRFEQADTRRLIVDLAALRGGTADATALDRFEKDWPTFQAQVMETTALPVQKMLPEFSGLFDQRKTFHEPFPDCSNTRWDDRLRRTARTHAYLSQRGIAEIFESDAFLRQGYAALLTALDRYDMHIGSYLLDRRDYGKLDESAQRALEDARLLVLDAVATLRRKWPVPILAESPAFETEPSADTRKAQIHAMEDRLRRGSLTVATLRDRRAEWALDRIVYYLAWGAGLLPDVGLDDLVAALKSEEENARTRGLVAGLQPLYYAVQCIDQQLTGRPDARTAGRLTEAIGEVQRFIDAHPGRDAGEHIARRIASIRQKLVTTAEGRAQ